MNRPKRLSLARLPTPIDDLPRLSAALGLDLRVKRDDLTGSHLSGNKIRKLEYLLADAVAKGATHVITCGGIQSNHCRATAWAARSLGLESVLYLRTAQGLASDFPNPARGNVLLNHLAGARLVPCTPAQYSQRSENMARLAEEVNQAGGRAAVIPEGGSNALGALGYMDAAIELNDQTQERPPTSVVVAVGSGGTLAGLALGLREAGLSIPAIGMAVCDDRATFEEIVNAIAREARDTYGAPSLAEGDVHLMDSYQGRGYALSSPEELDFIVETARQDGLLLDPVYTAKAFRGFLDLAARGDELLGDRPLFIHTGGLFGLMAAAHELTPHLHTSAR